MKKMLLGAVILMIGLLAACNDDEETPEEVQERVVPVETAEAESGDLIIEKILIGRTAPGSTTPVIIQSPGEVDSLEAENGAQVEEDDLIAIIRTTNGNQNVHAPKSGQVLQIQAEEGDMATNEEPFAIIADMDEIKLQLSVTADVRSLLHVDDTYTAVIDDEEYEAAITDVGALPDDTGLYPVEATVENPEKAIIAGMIAELSIPETTVEDTILVPTAAIVREDDRSYVYIVKNDTAEKVEVSILETQSDKTAIEADVQTGDQVVITGQLTLSDGAHVDDTKGE
ncbi:efflux RND transporter periplasmic adaptor subunit [Oceanobacillus damuensis]|uniref:efflux RND transporter periplasmic adaptor subunit n=1 Tax=Oceanobacillus damuensis TaxID=937928 RepID=UPI00082BCD59|nr:efflux RND transporter periplasmic adaptor subunit [Oceanobacillus damuensis]